MDRANLPVNSSSSVFLKVIHMLIYIKYLKSILKQNLSFMKPRRCDPTPDGWPPLDLELIIGFWGFFCSPDWRAVENDLKSID